MNENRCFGCMKLKTQSPVCEHCGYDETQGNATHQLSAGTVLKEQYLIGRVLGQGGFGITYLGWDLYLEIPVAIKEYFPSGLVMRETTMSNEVASCGGDAGVRFANNKERFFREAKMLARFSQMPEIVQVKNFFLANNTAYIVMEYVEGITLKQHVKNCGGKLSIEETFSILGPVMKALEKVHKSGLVHRDISPDNIMMLPGGGAKLLDFGAVRDVGAAVAGQGLTSSTESILKPGYAPIEQYQKRGSLGPWTDIYALCGTIYYCLTGSAPIDAPERVMEDPELHLETLVPELPEYRRHALEQGLALRAEERIASMAELNEALFPGKTEESPSAPNVEIPRQQTQLRPERHTVTERRIQNETRHKTQTRQAPVTEAEEPPQPPARRERREKKKSKLPLILAACAAAAALAIPRFLPSAGEEEPAATETQEAVSAECGDDLTWTLENGTLTIDGSGAMWDYSDTAAPWQAYASEITVLKLSDSLTQIGSGAFLNLSSLTSVEIPDSVTVIGEDAFRGTGLTEMEIPDGVISIGPRAFMDTPLQKVTMGEGLEIVGTRAFALCPQLETVEFNSNPMLQEHWDERIFTADEDRNAPEKLTILAAYGSYPWAYAAHYDIGYTSTGTLPTIGSGGCGQKMTWALYEGGVFVLEGSGNMSEFANSVAHDAAAEDIHKAAPWANVYDQIRLLYIGDEIGSIANRAFYGCESLQYLYYDHSFNNIGGYSGHGFFGFDALAYTGLIQLEVPAFGEIPGNLEGCKDLKYLKINYIPHNGGYMGSGSLKGCTSLEVLDVNWSVDAINWIEGANLFSADGKNVEIPAGLSVIGAPDTELERFCKENGISFAANINGYTPNRTGSCGDHVKWFLDRDQKTLVLYGDYEAQTNGVKADTWEFYDVRPEFYAYKDEIQHVFVTNDVTGLGACIFQDMTSLKTIDTMSNAHNGWEGGDLNQSDYSGIKRIGDRAFKGCTALECVEIPSSVTTLGTQLFLDCTALKEVYFTTGAKSLPSGTLAGCYSLKVLYCGGFSSFSKDVFKPHDREDDGHDYSLHVVVHCARGSGAETQAKNLGLPFQNY